MNATKQRIAYRDPTAHTAIKNVMKIRTEAERPRDGRRPKTWKKTTAAELQLDDRQGNHLRAGAADDRSSGEAST